MINSEDEMRALKRDKSIVKAVRKRMYGAPKPGGSRPSDGALATRPFLTSFIIDILRFEVYFGFSLRALRADSSLASLLLGFTNLAEGNQKLRGISTFYV